MAADPQKLNERLDALKADRLLHEHVWQECFQYSLPHLSAGLSGKTPLNAGEVQTEKARLLDGTAAEGIRISSDGLIGGLTPANSLWFGLDAGQESDEEKRWLSQAADIIFENIHASNYNAEAYDAMQYIVDAGWFVMFQDRADGGGYYFENWPIGECWISATRLGGRVDTVYRECEMTIDSVVSYYGMEKISDRLRQAAQANQGKQKVKILIAIEPRVNYTPGSNFSSELPWASCHMEVETKHILREGGFHEFPCMVPRWSRIPGSVYAVGMMSDALPDVKTLQEVKRWELAAAETAIAPPMKAVDDGVLNPRTVKLGPRKVIVMNSIDSMEPLITGAKVEYGQLVVESLQVSIRRCLMADLFDKLLNDPRMTATQVHAIIGVIRQRLGPRFGRMEAEFLQPLVERSYGIALRDGVLGKPPASLQQRQYNVRYLSPLARAQKLEDVSAMDRHETALMAEAAAVPSVLDTYDWDASARHRAELLGVPLKLIYDERKVAALRDEKAKAQQEAAQQAMAMEVGTKAAGSAASSMLAA